MRYLSAGFSHGEGYCAIIEGLPAGFRVDIAAASAALAARQGGYGRSERQKNPDRIKILSGLVDGATTGAPLAFFVKNDSSERKPFSVPRPGHADLAGAVKYGFEDLSLVAERASGRETVNTVAAGAIAEQLLSLFGVRLFAKVLNIGGVKNTQSYYEDKCVREMLELCDGAKKVIDDVKESGDTVGGAGEILITGLPVGLGNFDSLDNRLDGILAGAVVSIPLVKAVEFGRGRDFEFLRGSEAADILVADDQYKNTHRFTRKTNNAGGIEGGMANGSDIIIRFSVKPVPTLSKGVDSFDITNGKPAKTPALRADVCVVPAVCLSAKAAVALSVLDVLLKETGGATVTDISAVLEKRRYLCR